MANCDGIAMGATISCTDPLLVGVEQRVLLANLDDVESFTATGNLITAITMKTGKQFYEFAGVNQTIKARWELVRNATSNSYKHFVDLSVFDVSSAQQDNIEAMAYKEQVAIVIQRDDTSLGDNAISVYGRNSGLQLLTGARDLGDTESGAAAVLNLGTPDEGYIEPNIPSAFQATDYAGTLTAIDVLLAPAV